VKTKRRQIVAPGKRPKKELDPAENRLRAEMGDHRGSKAAELLGLLRQVASPNCKPALAALLSQEVAVMLKERDGDTLREVAELVERPVARPAEERAYALEAWCRSLLAAAADARSLPRRKKIVPTLPAIKRSEILESIMEQTNCSQRTAAAAIDKTQLSKLLGWKTGRPRG
jgi:hypothetical protein